MTRLVRVVAPNSTARLKLGARIVAGRMRHAVLLLAGIRGRAHVDEQIAFCIDGERMHGVIAGNRHAAQDRLGLARRRHLAVLQPVANNLVVDLGVEPILVEPDAGAAWEPSAKVGPKRMSTSAWPVPLVSLSATKNPPEWGVSLP